jgi:hypothetical protein
LTAATAARTARAYRMVVVKCYTEDSFETRDEEIACSEEGTMPVKWAIKCCTEERCAQMCRSLITETET